MHAEQSLSRQVHRPPPEEEDDMDEGDEDHGEVEVDNGVIHYLNSQNY
jgi:hypothetical protein